VAAEYDKRTTEYWPGKQKNIEQVVGKTEECFFAAECWKRRTEECGLGG
jgi:hypothetical protein